MVKTAVLYECDHFIVSLITPEFIALVYNRVILTDLDGAI